MRDVLGWRRKFGVIGPSTNTVVQPDFEMMRPVGVTNHYSRIFTPNAQAVSNETFMAGNQRDRRQRPGRRAQRDDLLARLSGHGHVGDHLLRRRQGRRRVPSARSRREAGVEHQHRLAFEHGGAESLRRRQAHRDPVALLSGRQRAGARAISPTSGFEVVRDICLAVQELDGDRRSAAGTAARAS